MAYGTKAGLERLIGDIVPRRKFSSDTVPSSTQVAAELDNVYLDLNSALDAMGYTVPVDETAYPHAYGFLKAANEYGAAARLLSTIPTEAYNPGEQMTDMGQTRAQMYQVLLNQALKRIWERKLRAAMRKGRFTDIRIGATADAYYKRGMNTYNEGSSE